MSWETKLALQDLRRPRPVTAALSYDKRLRSLFRLDIKPPVVLPDKVVFVDWDLGGETLEKFRRVNRSRLNQLI